MARVRCGNEGLCLQKTQCSGAEVEWLCALGENLLAFNRGLDNLYIESAAGRQPKWIAHYLDQGKPESLVRYARIRQIRRSCPTVIRPDVKPTPDGMLITELDAVPGGMGVIARGGSGKRRAEFPTPRSGNRWIAPGKSRRYKRSSSGSDTTGEPGKSQSGSTPPAAEETLA